MFRNQTELMADPVESVPPHVTFWFNQKLMLLIEPCSLTIEPFKPFGFLRMGLQVNLEKQNMKQYLKAYLVIIIIF